MEEENPYGGVGLSRSPRLVAERRKRLCAKVLAWSLITFFTGLAGFLCGNGVTLFCLGGDGRSVGWAEPGGGAGDGGGGGGGTPTTASPPCSRPSAPHRLIPLGGGVVDGGKYLLALCKLNVTQSAFFDEAKLFRVGGSTQSSGSVARWGLAQWRKLADMLAVCWRPAAEPCPYPPSQGPDEACPRARLLKQGLIMCYQADPPFNAWLRIGSVQLTTIESWVMLESLVFWRP